MKKIVIRIFPDGNVNAEVNGVKGKKCTEYIRLIEEILGSVTIDSKYNSEYYEKELVETEENQILKNKSNDILL